MATLVFNHEEIAARELKPELLEMDGISRAAVEAHYKLYEGYINKRNEILKKLADVDHASANQVYSELRALKIDLSFAIGGVKNHEIYFEHLGGGGGDPDGAVGTLIERDFGSIQDWRTDLKATGMGGRGWAWTAYDWDEQRLFNYIGDAQNTFPIWNADSARRAGRLRARLLPRLPDRPGFLHRRFLQQPRLGCRKRLGFEVPDPGLSDLLLVAAGYLLGSLPWGLWLPRLVAGVDVRTLGSGNIGATNVWRTLGLQARRRSRAARHRQGCGRCPPRPLAGETTSSACSPGARRWPATGGPSSWALPAAGRSSRRPAASGSRSRRSQPSPRAVSGSSSSS